MYTLGGDTNGYYHHANVLFLMMKLFQTQNLHTPKICHKAMYTIVQNKSSYPFLFLAYMFHTTTCQPSNNFVCLATTGINNSSTWSRRRLPYLFRSPSLQLHMITPYCMFAHGVYSPKSKGAIYSGVRQVSRARRVTEAMVGLAKW